MTCPENLPAGSVCIRRRITTCSTARWRLFCRVHGQPSGAQAATISQWCLPEYVHLTHAQHAGERLPLASHIATEFVTTAVWMPRRLGISCVCMRIRDRLCRLWSEASFGFRLWRHLICALTPAMGTTTFTIVMVTTLLMRCSVATRTLAGTAVWEDQTERQSQGIADTARIYCNVRQAQGVGARVLIHPPRVDSLTDWVPALLDARSWATASVSARQSRRLHR